MKDQANASSGHVYAFGPFLLDPSRRLLERDGQPIPLTPKAFDTLLVLVERRDTVTTKDELLQLVWPDVIVEESNLSQHISHLRKALDDEATEPRYIATLPKRGYRFVAPVSDIVRPQSRGWTERSISGRPAIAWTRPLAAVFVIGAVAVIVAALFTRSQPPQLGAVKFAIEPPHPARFVSVALSPDGGRLIATVREAGEDKLWIRSLDELDGHVVQGSEGGSFPFWSPDGRHVGFFAHGKLKTVDVLGGPPAIVCDAPNPRGGSWSRAGIIVFAPDSRSALLRVPATGGSPSPATTLDPTIRAGSHRWPYFLPDGRHFLYLAWSGEVEKLGTYVGSIDSRDVIRLNDSNSSAAYAAPGYLLFVRDENLMAQAFDAGRLTLSGYPFSVVEGLGQRVSNYAAFSISDRGVLAYHAVDHNTALVWYDRSGRKLGTVMGPARLGDPVVSHDGHQILVSRMDRETEAPDIVLYDDRLATTIRVTSDPGFEVEPVWSADATHIAYRSNRNGPGDLFVKSMTGEKTEELLLKNADRKDPTDWSPDGRFILYDNYPGHDPTRESDMWFVPLFGDRKPSPYQHTTFSAWGGRFSPDGRWVAYAADESGNDEVYVQSFPASGVSYRVSQHGGHQPVWRRDGRELFYLSADGTLIASAVHIHDRTVEVGQPTELFHPTLRSSLLRNHYDVSPDGQRFLFNTPVQDEAAAPITVVLNWTSTFRK